MAHNTRDRPPLVVQQPPQQFGPPVNVCCSRWCRAPLVSCSLPPPEHSLTFPRFSCETRLLAPAADSESNEDCASAFLLYSCLPDGDGVASVTAPSVEIRLLQQAREHARAEVGRGSVGLWGLCFTCVRPDLPRYFGIDMSRIVTFGCFRRPDLPNHHSVHTRKYKGFASLVLLHNNIFLICRRAAPVEGPERHPASSSRLQGRRRTKVLSG